MWSDLRTIRKNAENITIAFEPSEFAAEELEQRIANFKEGNRADYTNLSAIEEELQQVETLIREFRDQRLITSPALLTAFQQPVLPQHRLQLGGKDDSALGLKFQTKKAGLNWPF